MVIEFDRRTLSASIEVEGLGLHSGKDVRVKIEPSEHGIVFTCGSETVAAHPGNVTDTSRCTRLGSISTVEHLMSALAGLGVTDARIDLSAPECPAVGGSSIAYVHAIQSVGTQKIGVAGLNLFERVFFVEDPIRIGMSKGHGLWRFDFECGERWPNSQSYECELSSDHYEHEIAPARTFAFEEEIAPIRASGLAKGLDETSALVLGHSGYMNTPIWDDEPARHKLLDLIGDLYLSGVPPQCLNVVAVRSGHRTNVEAAKKLAAHAVIKSLS